MSIMPTDNLRFPRLRRVLLALFAAAAVVSLAMSSSHVAAQKGQQPPPKEQQQGPGQIALTPKHIEQYIAAFNELSPLFEKLDAAGDKPDPKVIAAIEAAVKKHGFRDLDDYDSVANSIVAVLDGIDPKTKQYVDPVTAIKQAIADVQKDKSMSAADRKKAIQELNAELKEVQPVQHKGNIQLVLKYYDRLSALTPQQK